MQTFASPNFGPLGYIHNGKIDYQRSPARLHTSKTPFDVSKLDKLPQVGIVYSYANATDLPAKAMVDAKFDGIVSAGVGNGNLYHTLFDTLAKASKDGIRVVRPPAYRPVQPPWMPRSMTPSTAFVAAETLNPQKARILLMLAHPEQGSGPDPALVPAVLTSAGIGRHGVMIKKGRDKVPPFACGLAGASARHQPTAEAKIDQPHPGEPARRHPPRLNPHHNSATASSVTSEETIMVLSSSQG